MWTSFERWSNTYAVGLRLDLNLCEPHICPFRANIDACGLHSLSFKRSTGRSTRNQQLNNIIWRALKRAVIPATKEPAGIVRGMESVQMASHWCHGKVGAASHGTLRSLIHWPSHTFKLTQLLRPVQLIQQLHVNTQSMIPFRPHIFVTVTIETLGPLCDEFRKSVFVSLQSLTILVNEIFYFREFQS